MNHDECLGIVAMLSCFWLAGLLMTVHHIRICSLLREIRDELRKGK